jgi:hypothetical protein
MPRSDESVRLLTLADAKELMDLCQQGKLYEIEQWIAVGRAVGVPPECKTTPLQIAMDDLLRQETPLLWRSMFGTL